MKIFIKVNNESFWYYSILTSKYTTLTPTHQEHNKDSYTSFKNRNLTWFKEDQQRHMGLSQISISCKISSPEIEIQI